MLAPREQTNFKLQQCRCLKTVMTDGEPIHVTTLSLVVSDSLEHITAKGAPLYFMPKAATDFHHWIHKEGLKC